MKWFDKWLYKKVKHMWEYSKQYETQYDDGQCFPTNNRATILGSNSVQQDSISMENSLNFRVCSALGGTIVQITHRYDSKTDRCNVVTHIIPDGDDISVRVGQIVSMELLRG